MDPIEMARKIADAAAFLDEIKSSTNHIPTETRVTAVAHVSNLHRIAEQLAGARAHEIYGPLDVTQAA